MIVTVMRWCVPDGVFWTLRDRIRVIDEECAILRWALVLSRARRVRHRPTLWMGYEGPILREDVDDFYGGVVPQGRWL